MLQLVTVDDQGQLHFKRIQDLHNEAAAAVKIMASPELAQALQSQQNYVVGYMAWQTDRFSKEVRPRPGGPVLMNLPGAEPALWASNPQLEALLAMPEAQSLASGPEVLELIQAGLSSDDPQAKHFFVVELVTRRAHFEQAAVQQQLKALITDPNTQWSSKQFILAFGGLNEQQLRSDWFCRMASDTLNLASTQVDQQGQDASYLSQLLDHLKHCATEAFPVNLARWVTGTHTGLAEAAIGALREQDLDQAIDAVEAGLTQGLLGAHNRQVLNNYLKRLYQEQRSKQKTQ